MTSNGVPVPPPPDPADPTDPTDAVMDGLPPPFPAPDPARFPNTRRRVSSTAPRANPDTHPADPDTCRICRGEGSPDEPLFYPCKCSGSIKHVHQDCLMEWLSHSQKKHCELCKTPFRFTKLYDPNMPKALPAHVFVSHTTKYLFRTLLVWMRAGLVVSVWLGWLPYLMRSVWAFLFWISDEGLGARSALGGGGFDLPGGAPYGTDVCPSSPLFAATTTIATFGGNLPPATLASGLYAFNLTTSDPIYATLIRLLFGTVGLAEKPAGSAAAARLPEPRRSLLSGVSFLQDLTRRPSVNRVVIDVLEGQIITVLVIVCFILIILVRDYVVQQQPEINMRAAFAENPQPVPAEDDQPEADEEQFEDTDEGDGFDDTASEAAEEDMGASPPQLPDSVTEPRPLIPNLAPPLPDPARPMQEFDRATVHEYLDIYRAAGGDADMILQIARERNLEVRLDYWMRLTRSMVARQRESEALATQAGPSEPAVQGPGDPFNAFVDLGTDLHGRPDIDPFRSLLDQGTAMGEGPDTAAFRSLVDQGTAMDEGSDSGPFGSFVDQATDIHDESGPASSQRPQPSEGGPSSNGQGASPKGKDKLVEDIEEAVSHPIGNPLRPRAHTDGPPVNDRINPLANNNWSFGDLPPIPAHWEGPSGPREPDTYPPWQTPESSATEPSLATADPSPAVAGPSPPSRAQAQQVPAPPPGLAGRVADFMWREVDVIDEADLAPVNVLGDFGEDDPEEEAHGNAPPNPPGPDREGEAGLDAEAIEDAEDLEGILELLGMRGPVAGLFQNAIFCAFLVSITIFIGVFIPYNIGRVTIWGLANPMRIARMVFSFAKFVQDCALLVLGLASTTLSESIHMLSRALMLSSAADYALGAVNASWAMAVGAANRIGSSFVTELPLVSASEVRNFSAISHAALFTLKDHIALAFSSLWRLVDFLFGGDYAAKGAVAFAVAGDVSALVWEFLKGLPTAIVNPSSWVLNLNLPETTGAIDPELAYWSGMDRFWAIVAGYVAMSLMAALYLRRGAPFSTTQAAQDWEASLIDGLNQASGVMKVILIISIEMLVFPLYCGMLLDLALLPLFEHTTLKSRVLFTANYPVTSIFVHWFIGTGYMFHFALFVSMCRKIMRKGVLYFIRDPDDPEFHPVRDVLERNVTTQLRKILFSAFVYGALVVMCLGGVVWGLYLCLPVLPIHYSSNEPVLEFPIDLLFYNFLMPFAVNFFKPSDGLHAMYTWWFRRCARALRITWFLFGERRIDEEGRLALAPDSPDRNLPPWRRWFLEIDEGGDVVARSWSGIFEGGTAPLPTLKKGHLMPRNVRKEGLVRSGQLITDGRFVRTPASDQVKIPKGTGVFLDVDEDNTRRDDMPDRPTDIYSTKQYQLVYVPPHFRLRIFFFTLFIWIFAAVTGVSITIVPLVFGRWMFKQLIPAHIRTNDIYAFSIGIHILGSAAYALFHARAVLRVVRIYLLAAVIIIGERGLAQRVWQAVARTARVVYTYLFVLVVAPLLAASLLELYALIPLNEMMYGVLRPGFGRSAAPVHTIRVVQTWTIGLLYLKLAMRITNTWFRGSRVSNAARAVLRRGWLDPDASILTRSFVVPGLAIWLAAVATPLLVAKLTIADGFAETVIRDYGMAPAYAPPDRALYDACVVLIYRMSFPLVALAIAAGLAVWSVVGVFRSWQVRIRDEAYLIGERLHNFGGANAPRPRGWRAGARM